MKCIFSWYWRPFSFLLECPTFWSIGLRNSFFLFQIVRIFISVCLHTASYRIFWFFPFNLLPVLRYLSYPIFIPLSTIASFLKIQTFFSNNSNSNLWLFFVSIVLCIAGGTGFFLSSFLHSFLIYSIFFFPVSFLFIYSLLFQVLPSSLISLFQFQVFHFTFFFSNSSPFILPCYYHKFLPSLFSLFLTLLPILLFIWPFRMLAMNALYNFR